MLNAYFRTNTAPEVGMDATITYVTDRVPTTIVAVSASGKAVTVWDGKAVKGWGWSPEAEELFFDDSPEHRVFTLRKNGRYVEKGQDQKGTGLLIGVKDEYRDPSF
jgi:hypothetical protein